ncbi:hypothetical protein FOA52_000236 [Chlamydomonas sp. UWO 241]|nr:hypothetical protein FOA52_000236 [Chlamydomonas sp. UWO 241]
MAPLHNRASPRPAAYVALACTLACACLSAVMAQPAFPPPPSPRPPPPTTRIDPVDCADLATPQVMDTAFFDASFTTSGTAFDCAYFVPTTLADATAVFEYTVAVTNSNPNGFISIYASNAPGAAPLVTFQANAGVLVPIPASSFNVSDGMYIVISADADATGDLAVLVTTVASCAPPLTPVGFIPLALVYPIFIPSDLLLNPPLSFCGNPDAVLSVSADGLVFSTVFDTTLLPASYARAFATTFAADLSALTGSVKSCYEAVTDASPSGARAEVYIVFNESDPAVNSLVGSTPTEICHERGRGGIPSTAAAGRNALIVASVDALNVATAAAAEPLVMTLKLTKTSTAPVDSAPVTGTHGVYPPGYGTSTPGLYGAYPGTRGLYPPAYGTPAQPPAPFRIQGGEVGTSTPTSAAANLPCALSVVSALFAALLLLM